MSHFGMRMPAAIPRNHFEPPWTGDRPIGILRTSKKPHRAGHEPAIDQNFQWAGTKAWNIHWTTPIRNNYKYLRVGAKVRKMTMAERVRPISKWGDKVGDWRRGPGIHSARPWSYAQCVAYAKKHGVIICAELKSPVFGSGQPAHYLVHAAQLADHPPWFMALYKMKNVRAKAMAIDGAGGQFALIFGTGLKRKPKDWANWSKYVTQVWGANWGGK